LLTFSLINLFYEHFIEFNYRWDQHNWHYLAYILIAAAMKTAQGSSTVAIITTASFVAPMISMLG